MGRVSKDSTAEPIQGPGFEGRYGETDGYTIGFERHSEHADMTPLFGDNTLPQDADGYGDDAWFEHFLSA